MPPLPCSFRLHWTRRVVYSTNAKQSRTQSSGAVVFVLVASSGKRGEKWGVGKMLGANENDVVQLPLPLAFRHPGIRTPSEEPSHHHSWARCPIMLMCPEISAIMMLFTRRPLCIFDGDRSSDSQNPGAKRHQCNIFPLFSLGEKLFPPIPQSFALALNNFKSMLLF